jgi:hypothetical protein
MGDSHLFMGALALLCGDDFLSKLQPNSGLEHAIGDVDSSPTPISVQRAPENRSPPSQSHITALAKDIVECPTAQLLMEASFATSSEPQLHRAVHPKSRTTSGYSTLDRRTAKFFPSCVMAHGRSPIAMAGTLV